MWERPFAHPTTWLNLMKCGQNGRYPPHPLAKLDELWAERPFPIPIYHLPTTIYHANGRWSRI
ncbi:MAG: hypothetical protein WBP47_24965 [Candidatus Promineifilaceae bacterium]